MAAVYNMSLLRTTRTSARAAGCQVRAFTHTTRRQQQPIYAAGSDTALLNSHLNELLHPNGRWALSRNGQGLERSYAFKSFKSAWNFMTNIATQATERRHHPEWSNVYKNVFVRWTTHNPPGISVADVQLAGICDRVASKGTQSEFQGERIGDQLEMLAEEAEKGAETNQGVQAEKETGGQGTSRGEPEKEAERIKEKEKVEKEERDPDNAEGSLSGIGGQPT